MEPVIDALVSAFENGTVSRRRFVQTLAMIAAGSPVAAAAAKSAGAAPAAVSLAAPWKTVWLDHICWGVQPWDTHTVQTELERRHLEPVSDVDGAYQSFHVKDPDGWDLQISNQTKR